MLYRAGSGGFTPGENFGNFRAYISSNFVYFFFHFWFWPFGGRVITPITLLVDPPLTTKGALAPKALDLFGKRAPMLGAWGPGPPCKGCRGPRNDWARDEGALGSRNDWV